MRSFYLELPHDEFAQRFPRERIPVVFAINTTQGLGRIATEFCASLATEGSKLEDGVRAGLGNQLMDHAGLHVADRRRRHAGGRGGGEKGSPAALCSNGSRRISCDPDLSLEKIAAANGMSLRNLHALFEGCEMSVSEWIWNRRLQLAYDCIAKGDGRSITVIAFDNGFNSSAHFSTMFRRKYGLAPRDVGGR